MSLQGNVFTLGDISGIRFDGDKGDVFPMHDHTEETAHFTIVARGRVKIHGPLIGEHEFSAGAMIDFGPNSPHEFIFLEDGTRFYQITKRAGNGYKQTPG